MKHLRPLLAKLEAITVRGWTLDVLESQSNSLNKAEFSLSEAYETERHLSHLHPSNKHVRDKIRQQLQVLRDLGLLDSLGRYYTPTDNPGFIQLLNYQGVG